MPILSASFPWGVLIAVLMVVSCATSGNPSVMNEDKIALVLIGQSTKENVRSTLGEPQDVTKRMDAAGQVNESWGYGFSSIESDLVTFIPIVGLFSGKSTAHVASLSITFASDGIVSRITRHNEKAESGPGAKPSPGSVVISR